MFSALGLPRCFPKRSNEYKDKDEGGEAGNPPTYNGDGFIEYVTTG